MRLSDPSIIIPFCGKRSICSPWMVMLSARSQKPASTSGGRLLPSRITPRPTASMVKPSARMRGSSLRTEMVAGFSGGKTAASNSIRSPGPAPSSAARSEPGPLSTTVSTSQVFASSAQKAIRSPLEPGWIASTSLAEVPGRSSAAQSSNTLPMIVLRFGERRTLEFMSYLLLPHQHTCKSLVFNRWTAARPLAQRALGFQG